MLTSLKPWRQSQPPVRDLHRTVVTWTVLTSFRIVTWTVLTSFRYETGPTSAAWQGNVVQLPLRDGYSAVQLPLRASSLLRVVSQSLHRPVGINWFAPVDLKRKTLWWKRHKKRQARGSNHKSAPSIRHVIMYMGIIKAGEFSVRLRWWAETFVVKRIRVFCCRCLPSLAYVWTNVCVSSVIWKQTSLNGAIWTQAEVRGAMWTHVKVVPWTHAPLSGAAWTHAHYSNVV